MFKVFLLSIWPDCATARVLSLGMLDQTNLEDGRPFYNFVGDATHWATSNDATLRKHSFKSTAHDYQRTRAGLIFRAKAICDLLTSLSG